MACLPTHNPDPIPTPRHTHLSYSDRVRNMARAGKVDSGYAGIFESQHERTTTLFTHTAAEPRPRSQLRVRL